MRTPRRRLFFSASTILVACGTIAYGETDITLGGDLGITAVVGLSKDSQAFSYTNFTNLNVNVEHSTDFGLIIGGKITLNTLDLLKFDLYSHTDPRGVEEHYLAKKVVPGPTAMKGHVFNASGGMQVSNEDIVAVKINSDWHSLDGTRTGMQLQVLPWMAENVCKLAGRLADTMNGQEGRFDTFPAGPTVGAANLYSTRGNGLQVGDQIRVFGGAGGYVAAGQFLAKRQIWANGEVTNTVSVAAPADIGARISVNPEGGGNGTAAAVFQKRYDVVKITPNMVGTPKTASYPLIAWQSTASKSATVLFSPGPGEQAGSKVNNAKVYAGPFAEIRTVGSSEKMVIGAICLEQSPEAGTTHAFMQPSSKILGKTGASIYVEGGFGKLTISTESKSGVIDSDGPWADIVSLSADDTLVLSADTSMFGITGMAAVTPNPGTRALNTIVGAKLDLGEVSVAADILYDPDVEGALDAWQLEAALMSMSDGRFALAFDSDDNWWIEAEYYNPLFAVEAQVGMPEAAPAGTPLYWWITGEIDVNGATLLAEYDQQRDVAFGLELDIGALETFARVERADEETTLRFGSTLPF